MGAFFRFRIKAVCFSCNQRGESFVSILLQLEISEMQKGFWFLKRGMKIDIMRVH